MKHFLIIFLLFLFFSCSNNTQTELKELFDDGNYEKTIEIADKNLNDSLDFNALFYKGQSYYRMLNFEEAEKASYLFILLSDSNNEFYFDAATTLIRSTDNNDLLLFAGGILYDSGYLSRIDYLNYYRALYANGLHEEARDFYFQIEKALTDYEKVLININSSAPSDMIVSALETLYSSDGLSERFISSMKDAIRLFNRRGDSQMLLNLVSYGDGDDASYMISIGDLMFNLGRIEDAATYWLRAQESYPRETRLRLRAL